MFSLKLIIPFFTAKPASIQDPRHASVETTPLNPHSSRNKSCSNSEESPHHLLPRNEKINFSHCLFISPKDNTTSRI